MEIAMGGIPHPIVNSIELLKCYLREALSSTLICNRSLHWKLMMKIIFVNPPISNSERYGALAPAGSNAPPLGLCSLAAVTRKKGIETDLIDAQAEKMSIKETCHKIIFQKPDYVGITAVTFTFESAITLAQAIKRENKNIIIVMGGVHVSALPENSLLLNNAIDILVLGEGEETIVEILKTKISDKNRDFRSIKGIAYRSNGKVYITEHRPRIKDLDSLPFPAWDLLSGFPLSYDIQVQSLANIPSTSIITSRGCTGKCMFCDKRIFGRTLRFNSAEYVIDMINDLYHNYGIRNIQFEDDNFMLFGTRLIKICNYLIKENLDLTWSCLARVDVVNEDKLKMMKKAKCCSILYGIESGSQKILDMMKKGTSLEQIEKAIEWTKKAGIYSKGFFITGYFGETRETLSETLEYIKRLKADDISQHYFIPFPGSGAYNYTHIYGKMVKDWKKMNFYEPVFIPNGLTEMDLINHVKKTYTSFYIRPRIFFNYIKRVKNVRQIKYFMLSFLALVKYLLTR